MLWLLYNKRFASRQKQRKWLCWWRKVTTTTANSNTYIPTTISLTTTPPPKKCREMNSHLIKDDNCSWDSDRNHTKVFVFIFIFFNKSFSSFYPHRYIFFKLILISKFYCSTIHFIATCTLIYYSRFNF